MLMFSPSFYSILVRLKVKHSIQKNRLLQQAFLFHTGSIKRSTPTKEHRQFPFFYSILVRLKELPREYLSTFNT